MGKGGSGALGTVEYGVEEHKDKQVAEGYRLYRLPNRTCRAQAPGRCRGGTLQRRGQAEEGIEHEPGGPALQKRRRAQSEPF